MKASSLLAVCCVALAVAGASALRAAAASVHNECHLVSDCTACVRNPRCGWCPRSAKTAACRAGDEEGPLDREVRCLAWAFRGPGVEDDDADAQVCEAAVVEEEAKGAEQSSSAGEAEPLPAREEEKTPEEEAKEEEEEDRGEEEQEKAEEAASAKQDEEQAKHDAASERAEQLRDALTEKQAAHEEEESAKAGKVAAENAERQEELDRYVAAEDLLRTAAANQATTERELHSEYKSLHELRMEENLRKHEEQQEKLAEKDAEEAEKFDQQRKEREAEEEEKVRPKQQEEQSKARERNSQRSEQLNLAHDVTEDRKLRVLEMRSRYQTTTAAAETKGKVDYSSQPDKADWEVNTHFDGGLVAEEAQRLREAKECGCDQYDSHGIEECLANCRQGR